jgi:hypothetical protein
MTKLTLTDIDDLRAYERQRDEFRRRVIAVKKLRRIHVGPIITLVFENRDTIRFQIQEMARAERLITDEAIAQELAVYNPLIPEPGSLAATLFVELTNDDALKDWLPRLVGIETQIALLLGEGDDVEVVRCEVDPEHEQRLTREEITASVHYVHFTLDAAQVERFEAGPVSLAVTHPAYEHTTQLSDATRTSLATDLVEGG